MVFSAHQPDVFPHAGFFYKVFNSDYFDLMQFAQFSKQKHQERVKIGHINSLSWLLVPIFKKSETKICDIALRDSFKNVVHKVIHKQYRDARYFKERIHILDSFFDEDYENLAELGKASIHCIVDFFSQDTGTPLFNSLGNNVSSGGAGILEIIERYESSYDVKIDHYLSGKMGKDYLNESCFLDRGIAVNYSEFNSDYMCSILTPIFYEKNPFLSLYGKEL